MPIHQLFRLIACCICNILGYCKKLFHGPFGTPSSLKRERQLQHSGGCDVSAGKILRHSFYHFSQYFSPKRRQRGEEKHATSALNNGIVQTVGKKITDTFL